MKAVGCLKPKVCKYCKIKRYFWLLFIVTCSRHLAQKELTQSPVPLFSYLHSWGDCPLPSRCSFCHFNASPSSRLFSLHLHCPLIPASFSPVPLHFLLFPALCAAHAVPSVFSNVSATFSSPRFRFQRLRDPPHSLSQHLSGYFLSQRRPQSLLPFFSRKVRCRSENCRIQSQRDTAYVTLTFTSES